MSKGCEGNCSSCSGCGRELVLCNEEVQMLYKLGQIPFLPVVRKVDGETPIDPENPGEETSLILTLLEKKGLISLDYDKPLKKCTAYAGYKICGSVALTARGQSVLELLETQGYREE